MATSESARRVLLVDCDMFYVQVARLEDPEGAGREELLIVGGSPSGRGVVTSASYACRAYGVRSAMPTAEALRLCSDAVVVGVDRGAVSRRSAEVRTALGELSPVVQAASVDEFYLDLTGTDRLFRGETLEASAHRIRETVLRRTRIGVSVGGGTNRLLAKLATRPAKPGGVFVVPPGGEQAFLDGLHLSDLPGVGPALLKPLADKGLKTVAEARAVEPEWLVRWLGEGRARWLLARLEGRDDSPVVGGEPRKSISSERTFPRDIDDDQELDRRLLKLTVGVCATLRDKGFGARTLTVKLRDADFTTRQRSHTFPEPVESDGVVFPVARELLHDLRRRRRAGARLLGVGLSNLTRDHGPAQLALFEERAPHETDRTRALNQAVDGLRGRFGHDAVLPAGIVPPYPIPESDD
ncbi:MAG: DNA polymerase IV [Gemmatimonadales bacterium]|nr:MAG: DNA polymerase IV [Gemmatimonadales bacterium]